jgi:hypothetical protein
VNPEILEISNNYTSSRKLPQNYKESEAYLFKNEFTWDIPNSKLFIYKNIDVSHEQIFFKGLNINYIISEKSTLSTVKKINKPYFFLKTLIRKKREITTPILWVTDLWSLGYYHWFSDVIQKIIIVKNHLYHKDFVLLLPIEYSKLDYVIKSLSILKIKTEFINPDEIVNYNEPIINEFRNLMLRSISQPKLEINERIYISRNKASRRKITNEEEIIPIIKKYGFKIIHTEDYDWETQLSIIRNAKYLMSLHGAGLTNMLFLKNSGTIIEIRKNGDSLLNCYFSLSSALNFDYYYFLANAINNEDHHSDYIVNCTEFEQLLSNIFN